MAYFFESKRGEFKGNRNRIGPLQPFTGSTVVPRWRISNVPLRHISLATSRHKGMQARQLVPKIVVRILLLFLVLLLVVVLLVFLVLTGNKARGISEGQQVFPFSRFRRSSIIVSSISFFNPSLSPFLDSIWIEDEEKEGVVVLTGLLLLITKKYLSFIQI